MPTYRIYTLPMPTEIGATNYFSPPAAWDKPEAKGCYCAVGYLLLHIRGVDAADIPDDDGYDSNEFVEAEVELMAEIWPSESNPMLNQMNDTQRDAASRLEWFIGWVEANPHLRFADD
jgi:hypothetical protein